MRHALLLLVARTLSFAGCGTSDDACTGTWSSDDAAVLVRGIAASFEAVYAPDDAAKFETLERALNGGKPLPRTELAALAASPRTRADLELRTDSVAVLQLSSANVPSQPPVVLQFVWERTGGVGKLRHGFQGVPESFRLEHEQLVSASPIDSKSVTFHRAARQ